MSLHLPVQDGGRPGIACTEMICTSNAGAELESPCVLNNILTYDEYRLGLEALLVDKTSCFQKSVRKAQDLRVQNTSSARAEELRCSLNPRTKV